MYSYLFPSMLCVQYALGDTAYKTYISSTKSMMGHSLGAAGGLEAAICAKVGRAPPHNSSFSPPLFFANVLIIITSS